MEQARKAQVQGPIVPGALGIRGQWLVQVTKALPQIKNQKDIR